MTWDIALREYIEFLKTKHQITDEDIQQELNSIRVPAHIYAGEATPLEATSKYLHKQGYSTKYIAETISRNPRDILKHQQSTKHIGPESGPTININAFADRTLSAGEHIVEQLHKQGLSITEIAEQLDKNEQTIWTQHYRALEKRGEIQ